MIREDAIFPVPEMKVDDLLRVYFSLGALGPDSMPKSLKINPKLAASQVPVIDPAPVPAAKRRVPQDAAE